MKNILTGFCLLVANICLAQCDTTGHLSKKDSLVRSFIGNLNSESYRGETIGDVLKKDMIKDYCDYFYIQKIVGVFSGVQLRYKGFISLQIFVPHTECTGFGRSASAWDFEKIKKCKVYKIRVLDFINEK